MKHQVFLLLSIYFFSAYSMNRDISTITKDELVSALTGYNHFMEKNFPNRIDTQALQKDIEVIKAKNLSDFDKKEILADMRLLPSSIDYEMSNFTKTKVINDLTDFNYHMKTHYPDFFDCRRFGLFIMSLRGINKDVFEMHKQHIVQCMEILPNFVYERDVS